MDFNKPFRCHSSIIVENVVGSIWIILASFVLSVDDVIRAIRNMDKLGKDAFSILIGAGVLFVIIGLFTLFFFLRWRKTLIHFEKQLLIVNKNFMLSKKKITIPLEKISTVDYSQNFFERIIGTCRLKLDVNSSILAEKTDLKLVFKLDMAQQLKAYILNGVDENTAVQTTVRNEKGQNLTEKPQKQVKFSALDLLKYTIIDTRAIGLFFSLVLTVGIPVLTALIPQTFMDKTGESFINIIKSYLSGPGIIVLVILFIVILVIMYAIGFAAGFIKNFIKFYDFSASRDKNIISVSYGLINFKKYSFPVNKITSVTIKRSLIARITGYCCVEVQTIGIGDEKNESSLICPSCGKKDFNRIMNDFLPEFIINGTEIKQPKAALAVNYIRLAITMLVICAVCATILFSIPGALETPAVPVTLCVLAAAALISALFVFLFYRTKSVTLNDKTTMINSGIIAKRSVLVQNRSIQHTVLKHGPVTRLFNLYNTGISLIFTFKNGRMSTGLYPLSMAEKVSELMVMSDCGTNFQP